MSVVIRNVESTRTRPPRALNVVRDPVEVGARIDWSSWYLTDEEDMGESVEQANIIRLFLAILEQLARERGWQDVYFSGDQFFAWLPDEPLVRISPDIYLQPGALPVPAPRLWETWRPDHPPPRLAVEVVSAHPSRPFDWRKDDEHNPAKYAQLGTDELVIFDPAAACGRASEPRVPLQVYRREQDGAFVRVHRGGGPERSETLDAWLVVTMAADTAFLRLAHDAEGRDLVPSTSEALTAAEAANEAERAARELAEAEVERLRAELDFEGDMLRPVGRDVRLDDPRQVRTGHVVVFADVHDRVVDRLAAAVDEHFHEAAAVVVVGQKLRSGHGAAGIEGQAADGVL